ncbi:MAG: rRNA maturation RNase YbeY [Chloroflexota bacterium]|nr:rRNA maturation RNase YbeY [Chloroflexota bacterium]
MTIQHVVDVRTEIEWETEIDLTLLRVTALAVLKQQGVELPNEVTIVLTGDDTLQALNQRFRGVDRPTDVLSFADDSRGPFDGGSVEHPRYLGDIIISLPQAAKQATAATCGLLAELQLLIVHGMLHLLGYDHATPAAKARMWKVQATLLELLGTEVTLPA